MNCPAELDTRLESAKSVVEEAIMILGRLRRLAPRDSQTIEKLHRLQDAVKLVERLKRNTPAASVEISVD
jgi:hypothetical protein